MEIDHVCDADPMFCTKCRLIDYVKWVKDLKAKLKASELQVDVYRKALERAATFHCEESATRSYCGECASCIATDALEMRGPSDIPKGVEEAARMAIGIANSHRPNDTRLDDRFIVRVSTGRCEGYVEDTLPVTGLKRCTNPTPCPIHPANETCTECGGRRVIQNDGTAFVSIPCPKCT